MAKGRMVTLAGVVNGVAQTSAGRKAFMFAGIRRRMPLCLLIGRALAKSRRAITDG
jgi:hypothetical protein